MEEIEFESATVFYDESNVSKGSILATLTTASGAGKNTGEFSEYTIEFSSHLLSESYVQKATEEARQPNKKKIILGSMTDGERDAFLDQVTWDESDF